jgi:hypothetical protein
MFLFYIVAQLVMLTIWALAPVGTLPGWAYFIPLMALTMHTIVLMCVLGVAMLAISLSNQRRR